MNKSNIDQYKVQSYFKGVCENFCIVFKEVKRLENQKKELQELSPTEELKLVNKIMGMLEQKESTEKYITHKYSKEELEKEKQVLQEKQQECNDELKKCEIEAEFWNRRFAKVTEELEDLISAIRRKGLTVIVTSEEEIIALMYFYRDNSVKTYDIINIEEKNLIPFPDGKKMYEDFYSAYCLKDDEEMERNYNRYF